MTDNGDEGVIKVSESGLSRVRLIRDGDQQSPRKEFYHLGHAITAYSGGYLEVDEDNGPLGDVWLEALSLTADWSEASTLFERYCAIHHLAVTYRTDQPAVIWYLMAEDFHEVDNPLEAIRAEAREYQSWAEGDVWGIVIETRPTEEDEWEEEPGLSFWGLIGGDYAEKAVREAFGGQGEGPAETG